jgi:non-lysosomal glucosylceramidase
MARREFVHTAAVGGAALAASFGGLPIVAGPFHRQEGVDHFVPEEKRLTRDWVQALFARGESTWYSGEDLQTIGMPVGGICAGQMYLTGDGRLACWDIFNQNESTGAGAVNYAVGRAPEQTVHGGRVVPAPAVAQGFAIRVRGAEVTVRRTLDGEGFPGVRFCGEYPLGRVRYEDESVPVKVELLAFSPFIPLNADDSALPATVLRYSVRNTSSETLEVEIAGWLENVIGLHTGGLFGQRMLRRNQLLESDLLTGVVATAEEAPVEDREPKRDPIVFATFEGEDYGDWRVEGSAFGSGPAGGTLESQNPVSGYEGGRLVNTYLGGDAPLGRLTSPTFTVERPWITFLVGGGSHEGRTCVNLVVEEEVVRSTTGLNRERLEPHSWNVEELLGRRARLEIVDEESGGWGHINVDQIEFRDGPRTIDPGRLQDWPDVGSLCLAMVGQGSGRTSVPGDSPKDAVFGDSGDVIGERSPGAGNGAGGSGQDPAVRPATEKLVGAVSTTLSLEPGGEGHVTFILSWFLPNMYREDNLVGNRYAVRFDGADAVANYLAGNLQSLMDRTHLWHQTYYDSTLPRWLLDRVHSTVSTLSSSTCQWWKNGRFWAWEGAGCCRGTCGHVWNYEHAMARLFPDLERSVREMQDFAPGVGLNPETGAIGFRGEGWALWAGDAQGGYILKALREHQTSPDDAFLRRNWPNVRKAVEFLMREDGDADGLLEGQQHQTYDENYFGANTMVGSLYLGALRAAEEMAWDLGEGAFARQCREIFEAGSTRSVERLFNGEYFIQDVDLEEHPDWQYGDGCLADQLFGQGWAHQVGLGYLYPKDTVRTALRSIWKYCWAPDVGPQNDAHVPERWFALPGEAGLFTCTWPKSPHMGPRSTRYRNEIWTGIEYQVAGHMAWEGMLTEALAICRGIHERYHPSKHNPWNEIECGDHYARALASWTLLTGLSGFRYHGPRRRLGFAPRITPEDFRCPFTAAEGWGTLAQERSRNAQTSEVSVALGIVPLSSLELEVPEGAVVRTADVTLRGSTLEASLHQESEQVALVLPEGSVVGPGEALRVVLPW